MAIATESSGMMIPYEVSDRESIPRRELLYDERTLFAAVEEHGKELDIKRKVDTTAKVYEIRTAIRYWSENGKSYRTSDVMWERLRWFDQKGLTAEEADSL